ncbi:MAG: HNH endonuclease signature motif containing protein [Candidatus Bathyarchaeia archaeon]
MVSTYPASVRYWVREYLAVRDGLRCAVCGASSAEVPLEIDHIDGDPGNWAPENLRLLCHRDNVKEYWRKIKERTRLQPPPRTTPSEVLAQAEQLNQSEDTIVVDQADELRERNLDQGGEKRIVCERESLAVGDELRVERQLSVVNESPEMRVNREKEPMFRVKCINLVLRPEGLTVDQALHEVPEIVQISPVTAGRYLKKMTSEAGPLVVGEGPRGHQRLLLRESYWLKQRLETDLRVGGEAST